MSRRKRKKRKLKPPNDRELVRGYKGTMEHAPVYEKPLATLKDAFEEAHGKEVTLD